MIHRNHAIAPTRASTQQDIDQYLEYESHGVEVLEDGLKQMTFGEYLVEKRRLNRFQLFRALQMQDRNPDARIGECVASLGFLSASEVEGLLAEWNKL